MYNANTVLVPPGACSQPGFHKKLRSFALSPIDRPASSRERREELREKIERYQNIDRARFLWGCNDYAFVAEAKVKTIELRHKTLELFKKIDASETMAVKELRRDIVESQTSKSLDPLTHADKRPHASIDLEPSVLVSRVSNLIDVQADAAQDQLQLSPTAALKPIAAVGEEVGAEELARRKSKIKSLRSTMRKRLMNREFDPASPENTKNGQKTMFDRNRSTSTISSSSTLSSPLSPLGTSDGPLFRMMSVDLGNQSEDSCLEGKEDEDHVVPGHKKSLASVATVMNSIEEIVEEEPESVQYSSEPPTSGSAAGKSKKSLLSTEQNSAGESPTRLSKRLSKQRSSGLEILEGDVPKRMSRQRTSALESPVLFETTRDIANIIAAPLLGKRESLERRLADPVRTVEQREGRIRLIKANAGLILDVQFASTTRRKGDMLERTFTSEELAEVFTWGLMCEKPSSERYSWFCGLVFIKRGADKTIVGLKHFDDAKNKASEQATSIAKTVQPTTDNQIATQFRGLFQSTMKSKSFWDSVEGDPVASSRGLKTNVADVLHGWFKSMNGSFDLTNHSLIPFIRKLHSAIGRREVDHEQLGRILAHGRDLIPSDNCGFEQFLDWLVYLFPHLRNMLADDVQRFADLVERQSYDPEVDLESFTEAMSAL